MSSYHRVRLGALLFVLLFMTGAFAAVPYWHAQAGDKTLFGVVTDCADETVTLAEASVTLTETHGFPSPTPVVTAADGVYSFTPSPGYYDIRITKAGYFDVETAVPVRFDGSVNLRRDMCLDKMPTKDRTLDVLVVDSARIARDNETLIFAQGFVANENLAPSFAGGDVTTVRHPVNTNTTTPARAVRWSANGSATKTLTAGTDYQVLDYFRGKIRILNATIADALNWSTDPPHYLNATYYYSVNATQVQSYPIAPGGVLVYKNGLPWPAGPDWSVNITNGVFQIHANFSFGVDTAKITYEGQAALSAVSVGLFYAARDQVVASGLTNASGGVRLDIWADSFELQASEVEHQLHTESVDTGGASFVRVTLLAGVVIVGLASSTEGPFVEDGLVGYLYNLNAAVPDFKKVIRAKVDGSKFTFYAYAGTYRMMIDADGFAASTTTINVPATSPTTRFNRILSLSENETFETRIAISSPDWNRVTVWRNRTLNADSSIFGLSHPDIRNARLQIDLAFGDKEGNASVAEALAFQGWLLANGPRWTTTNAFLSTNGKVYNSTATSFTVAVNVPASGPIEIRTRADYDTTVANAIVNDLNRYFVNVTGAADANATVYQDRTFVIKLPARYEMTSKKITGAATVTGWTEVTFNPGLGATTPRLEMVVDRSEAGIARARITDPVGRFFAVNDTVENYTAYVSRDTNLTFSAEESTDPIGDIAEANFTWRFRNNTAPADPNHIGYNITATYLYDVEGEFVANLTVTEAGGNRTYRDIRVFVDGTPPIAVIKHNKTTADNANDTTAKIAEDQPIRFDATNSTDEVFAGKAGDIEEYRWDFDGDGIVDRTGAIVNHTFDTPGTYTMNLTVVDSVGHEGMNATMTWVVWDVTPPVPNFVILDGATFLPVTSLVEGKRYYFNASSTLDNHDNTTDLQFSWKLGYEDRTGTGMNVSVVYEVFNSSYVVDLNVTDTGFGTDPLKRNFANITRSVNVQVNTSARPDLQYVLDSLVVEPGTPEEDQVVTISVNVTNLKGRGNATSVRARLLMNVNDQWQLLTDDPEWFDASGNPTANRTIPAEGRVKLVFRWIADVQGDKRLEVRFNDTNEPYTWVDESNRVVVTFFVNIAGWKTPALIGGVIAAIVAIVIAFRLRRKAKAGELKWSLPRLRKKEGEKAKGKEPKKKEKKRL